MMSADNVIVVKKQEDKFFVWHDFMSILEEQEECVPPTDSKKFDSLEEALEDAGAMSRDYDTEYGIAVVE